MCLLCNLHITLLYVVVSQMFIKQLYLRRCLNGLNHNTCTHFPQNSCAKDGIFRYLSRSQNRRPCRRCHDNHNNNRLKCLISMVILTSNVSHCFCLKLSFGQYSCLELFGNIGIIERETYMAWIVDEVIPIHGVYLHTGVRRK